MVGLTIMRIGIGTPSNERRYERRPDYTPTIERRSDKLPTNERNVRLHLAAEASATFHGRGVTVQILAPEGVKLLYSTQTKMWC
jgi:hypothetical protein